MLSIEGLRKSYGSTPALDGVSLQVPPGEMLGIVGRSGAGKSTLLRCINRLVDATSGSITHNGRQILSLQGNALYDWRAECGMIFQEFHLIDRLDALTNVLLGAVRQRPTLPQLFKVFPDADRQRALDLLTRLDLKPQAHQRVSTLSGGQRQRVAIARSLMQGVQILLADEPVASLDPQNAQVVMQTLKSLPITVLCNLHHLDLARDYCTRVVGMAHGKITFDGPPADIPQHFYTADQS
jgi:phosphonate transport system ATP-binding protein